MVEAATWVENIVGGSRLALARALTRIENDGPEAGALLDEAARYQGRAVRIGITGPPGAGKSTLIEALIGVYRARQRTVGVLAVDPSSTLTGGALLGDRVRMARAGGDPGVFVRSMATRGRVGGLAPRSIEALELLEAAGFERVLLETVGVGQADVDVRHAVDIVVVVVVPEAGDGIQGMKAGLIELGDVVVVNKSDRPGARELHDALVEAFDLRVEGRRDVPVLMASATGGEGIEAVVEAVESLAARAVATGALLDIRRHALRGRLRSLLAERLLARVDRSGDVEALVAEGADRILDGSTTPGREIDRILARLDG